MKRLLICSPSHALFGGVETIVNDLCRELPKHGWDAILALGKGSRFNDVGAYRSAHPDLPTTEIDGTKGTRQARLEALTKLIDSIRPDALLSARIFDSYEAATRLKVLRGWPRLVVAIRAFEPYLLYDARLYKDCIDLCVADGNVLEAALLEWCGLAASKVVNIPGGIRPPSTPVRPRVPKETLCIGYVGRLEEEQKRVFDLIPFMQRLDAKAIKYSVDIIGTGPQEVALRQRIEEGPFTDRVVFHGWQEQDSLYTRFFPRMDCLIHFAHTEGVTIAPREAMVHGVVPVISQFTGLKSEHQFVNEWNSLTFPVGDIDSAAASIGRLISEPGLMERLSKNALVSQRGKYTFDGSMDAWAEALDRCLEKPRAICAVPKLNGPADGRLSRLGLSPRVAQRMRDIFGRQHLHGDPGSEWPTGSGLLTEDVAAEIMRFAADYERTTC